MEKKNIFTNQTFLLGLVSGVAVVALVGFVGLLAQGKDGSTATADATKTPVAVNQPTPSAPTPAQPTPANIQVQPVSDDDHVRGNRNAKVSLIEFSDLECPFCKRFHPTMQQVMDTYGDEVNWVYRHFPLDSLHPKARREAEATECAGEVGGNDGFWKYLDRLFEITPANNGLQDSQLPQIAEDVGLDRVAFETCLASGKYAQHVADDLAEAQAAGGRGTPYSVIVAGDQKIPVSGAVSFTQIQSIIDSLL